MRMPTSRAGWLAATTAAFGLFWLLWLTRPAPSADAAQRPQASTPDTRPMAAAADANRNLVAPIAAGDPGRDRPPGASPEQWNALKAEMRGRADGPTELRRLAGYLEWSDALSRFRAAHHAGANAADLLLLAQALDDGLPERLHRAEVSAAEARQIKSAILEVTVTDESVRAAQLQQWAAAMFAPASADPRQAVFERRQSEIVAAWSAQPAAARDHAALERELEGARRQSFSNSAR